MTISPVAHRPATPVIEVNVLIAFPKGTEPYILRQQGGRASVCVGPAAADRPRPGPNDARSDRPDDGHAATQTDVPTQIEARPDQPGVGRVAAQADLPTQMGAPDGGNANRPQACVPQEYQLTLKQLKFLRNRRPCYCRNRPGPDNLDPQSRDLERGVPRLIPDTSTGPDEQDYPESIMDCLFSPFPAIAATAMSYVAVYFMAKCGICKPESKLKIWLVLGLVLWVGFSICYFDDRRTSPLVRTGHVCEYCRGVTGFGRAGAQLADVDGRVHLAPKAERGALRKSKPE